VSASRPHLFMVSSATVRPRANFRIRKLSIVARLLDSPATIPSCSPAGSSTSSSSENSLPSALSPEIFVAISYEKILHVTACVIEFFLHSVNSHPQSSSSVFTRVFYISGAIEVITSNWRKCKNLARARRNLLDHPCECCDLVIRSCASFLTFPDPPYIVEDAPRLEGNFRNRMDNWLQDKALVAIGSLRLHCPSESIQQRLESRAHVNLVLNTLKERLFRTQKAQSGRTRICRGACPCSRVLG
jgi:hypothetical protein